MMRTFGTRPRRWPNGLAMAVGRSDEYLLMENMTPTDDRPWACVVSRIGLLLPHEHRCAEVDDHHQQQGGGDHPDWAKVPLRNRRGILIGPSGRNGSAR